MDVIKIGVIILIILGGVYLLNTHADNTREYPNATNTELISETTFEAGEDVAIIGKNLVQKSLGAVFNGENKTSTTKGD